MLENYFEAAATLTRLRSGPPGPFIDGFAASLHEAGYRRWTARGYLRAAAHLGVWMQRKRVIIRALDEGSLRDFANHLPRCKCLRRNSGVYCDAVAGNRLFLGFLRDQGILPQPPRTVEVTVPEVVAQFEQWMRHHRGVTASTLVTYRLILVELHEAVGGPEAFHASSLRAFVSARASRHGRSRAKTVVAAVRMFVRYAAAHGLCSPELVEALPTIAEWKLATLPAYLSREDVERLIDAPDPRTCTGQRDRAILLLLARLGLRAGDIIGLRLSDLDWGAGTLLVAGKSRRPARLPLPQDAGDALLLYLAQGRPDVLDDHVFLRVHAPIGRLQRPLAVSDIVNRTAARAGVQMPRGGAHVLRHSMATALVRDGVPLTAVRAVLRHQSEQMTAHYAKVDVSALHKIAHPWPMEVWPC